MSQRDDFRALFEFPWRLYKDDPNWVPPLLSIRRERFDRAKNPAWDYVRGEHFIAVRAGETVGTVTALINPRHNDFHGENVGWFGDFELIDDQAVADALLQTAAAWVREQGADTIRGPQFTTHEECGLLVDGFERPPVILMPYNPPYYMTLLENAGFVKAMDVVSLYLDRELVREHGMEARLDKLVARAAKRSNITVRSVDTRRLKEEFKLFKELYNDAWAQNWGFVPMTDRELDALVDSLGMFFDRNLAFFAEVDGVPAGFSLSVPDFNEVLHKVYPRPGVPEWWSLLRALYYWKGAKVIRGVRTPLMGVRAEFRNKGVELALLRALLKAIMPSQYTYLDSGWVLESNELVKISLSLGNKIYKRHRFYERKLT